MIFEPKMQETIKIVINAYTQFHPVNSSMNVRIIFEDDVSEFVKKYTNVNILMPCNGTVVFENIENEIIVVISNTVFELDEWTWIGTIHHEMTHANDMYEYCTNNFLRTMDEMFNCLSYTPFVMWSEYHARKNGYYAIRKLLCNSISKEDRKKNADEVLLQMREDMKKRYTGNIYSLENVNDIMQHLGRLAVFAEEYPEKIDNFFQSVFENILNTEHFEKVKNMFEVCYKCKEIEQAMEYINEIDDCLIELMK